MKTSAAGHAEALWLAGESFLALASGNVAPGAGPDLMSFSANLQQHLTQLTLEMYLGKGEAAPVGALGMLTALERLTVDFAVPDIGHLYDVPQAHHSLSEGKLVLKLPHLVYLHLTFLAQGELVLSCPQLAEARIECTIALHIHVEDAALTSLVLLECKEVQCSVRSPEDQLLSLVELCVCGCDEVGRHLIQDVGLMRHLQRLDYQRFPAECMPQSFPDTLRAIQLFPHDWEFDLPSGLKHLHELEFFQFDTTCDDWEFETSLDVLLPLESIQHLEVGPHFSGSGLDAMGC